MPIAVIVLHVPCRGAAVWRTGTRVLDRVGRDGDEDIVMRAVVRVEGVAEEGNEKPQREEEGSTSPAGSPKSGTDAR